MKENIKENWLSLTLKYLEDHWSHLQIAGTEAERQELQKLIKYLN